MNVLLTSPPLFLSLSFFLLQCSLLFFHIENGAGKKRKKKKRNGTSCGVCFTAIEIVQIAGNE